MTSEIHGTAESRVRSTGQRYTERRRRLVDILSRAGSPQTIADILRGRRDLAQSSVYRNLAVLERAGVVHRVLADDEFARYELTESLTGHHHHLICSNCGRVEDVTMPKSFERSLNRTIDRLAAGAGFATVSHRLDLLGRCRNCMSGAAEAASG
ncbi:MAG TPA: Fur family transcriptional regulator [Actinomycetota bacterium]|nr:Fur family transcriptional regulator [Actinomycetota bacterium]